MTSSSSRNARAAISPVGATMADPPIMANPSSAPHFAAANTQAAF